MLISDVERILKARRKSTINFETELDQDITRYEFAEVLVRIAEFKYINKGSLKFYGESLKLVID